MHTFSHLVTLETDSKCRFYLLCNSFVPCVTLRFKHIGAFWVCLIKLFRRCFCFLIVMLHENESSFKLFFSTFFFTKKRKNYSKKLCQISLLCSLRLKILK